MDAPRIEAVSGAIEQIRNFHFAKTLVLIGPCDRDGQRIFSCSQLGDGRDLSEEVIIINSYLPAGVGVCGLFLPQSSSAPLSSYVMEMITGEIAKKLFPSGRVVLLFTNEDEDTLESKAVFYELQTGQRRSCDLNIVSGDTSWEQSVLMFRIRSEVSMKCFYKTKSELPDVFLLQYTFLKNQLQSPSTLYHIQKTSILIGSQPNALSSSTVTGPLSPSNRIQDVLKHLEDEEEDDGFGVAGGGGKRNKKAKLDGQVLDVKVMFKTSSGLAADEDDHIPVVLYNDNKNEMQYLAMNLPLDVVVMAPASSPVSDLASLFIEGVCRQLQAKEICIARHYENHEICKPEAYHFKPMGLQHLLTVIYPAGVTDKDLETTRQSLHQQFILPLDRPLLRRLNTYMFPEVKKQQVYLMNTHIGLPSSGVSGGKQSLVQGNYTYHHYMQDRFNDDQWGCAYRSLQTLCSWFKLQGYVDCSIPTHREIQQALVDVGDKQAKFVGSKQWIGSIEVNNVLNQLLGVTSKIMFVPNGEEMATKGRELAAHFEVQGTPVMIGGGVLAHTILGVDFNEKTGDLKFLILDPHYTGSEDLKTIQDKGWCGWKSIDFWDKTAYYNLCLPQRPVEL